MNMKEKIKKIFIEELSKCNNFKYEVPIGNLYLIINTKKIYKSLISISYKFTGKVGSSYRFDYHEYFNDMRILNYTYLELKKKLPTVGIIIKDNEKLFSILKDIINEEFNLNIVGVCLKHVFI